MEDRLRWGREKGMKLEVGRIVREVIEVDQARNENGLNSEQ